LSRRLNLVTGRLGRDWPTGRMMDAKVRARHRMAGFEIKPRCLIVFECGNVDFDESISVHEGDGVITCGQDTLVKQPRLGRGPGAP
jgi:hypothetical protein